MFFPKKTLGTFFPSNQFTEIVFFLLNYYGEIFRLVTIPPQLQKLRSIVFWDIDF